MLEDQREEQAALYALGLLEPTEARAFEHEAASDPSLRTVVDELRETLANLSLATTPIRLPDDAVRSALLDRVEREPARVMTDSEGRLVSMNPALTRLCGYAFSELQGRKPGHLLQGADTDPVAVDRLRAAIHSGASCVVELTNYHKDGSPYRVRISLEPCRDASGILTGFEAVEEKLD